MILTTLVMLCSSVLQADSPRSTLAPARAATTAGDAENAKPAKPDAPTPKVVTSLNEGTETSAEPSSSSAMPIANVPVRPATTDSYETPRKRTIWYGLIAAGHAGAAFDAWTTRRAVSGGYGVESDPFQKPFAHSGAIYATTQISPLVMDYVGYRMMRSRYRLLRKFWWVPQTANASFSFGAGIHNDHVVP